MRYWCTLAADLRTAPYAVRPLGLGGEFWDKLRLLNYNIKRVVSRRQSSEGERLITNKYAFRSHNIEQTA